MNPSSSASVSRALETIKTARNTPIILDFDETLFLRNSTSEYLNNIRPRILGALLLRLLNYIKPWNWLPYSFRGEKSRDWLLIVILTCLFPWSILVWQRKAKELAQYHSNQELIRALQTDNSNSIIVATLGFRFIVNPILKNLPLNYEYLIACSFWHGLIDRHRGKLAMSLEALGNKTVERAIAITNSLEDLPLLQQVAQPFYIIWSKAKYATAMADIYLPFVYSEKAKRPGKKYLLRVILGDDLVILLLAFTLLLEGNPLWNALSLLLMLVSFWCIYEVGYLENDLVAEKFEASPTLSAAYQNYKNLIQWWQPWLWASAIAMLGVLAFQKSLNPNGILNYVNSFNLWINWMFFLIIVRSLFGIYNHVNKQSRVWLYLLLQITRYFGFIVIFPTNAVGTMLMLSQTLSRWIPYAIYRYAGGSKDSWPMKFPRHCLRLTIYILLVTSMALGTPNLTLFHDNQAIIIAVFCFLRAGNQIGEIMMQLKPVWQDNSN